jgi:hypothetical protein
LGWRVELVISFFKLLAVSRQRSGRIQISLRTIVSIVASNMRFIYRDGAGGYDDDGGDGGAA